MLQPIEAAEAALKAMLNVYITRFIYVVIPNELSYRLLRNMERWDFSFGSVASRWKQFDAGDDDDVKRSTWRWREAAEQEAAKRLQQTLDDDDVEREKRF